MTHFCSLSLVSKAADGIRNNTINNINNYSCSSIPTLDIPEYAGSHVVGYPDVRATPNTDIRILPNPDVSLDTSVKALDMCGDIDIIDRHDSKRPKINVNFFDCENDSDDENENEKNEFKNHE